MVQRLGTKSTKAGHKWCKGWAQRVQRLVGRVQRVQRLGTKGLPNILIHQFVVQCTSSKPLSFISFV